MSQNRYRHNLFLEHKPRSPKQQLCFFNIKTFTGKSEWESNHLINKLRLEEKANSVAAPSTSVGFTLGKDLSLQNMQMNC